MLQQGAFRLFRLSGIQVWLHWTWFLVAVWQINRGRAGYSNLMWMVFEYVALFGIVLMHEFGHSLACRSVGGRADQILLWPFGGIALVQPPRRPGAVFWSIAAGPLVNVVLIPVILILQYALPALMGGDGTGEAGKFLHHMGLINAVILIFNLLPIYPLDGGQLLQAILWFVLDERRSLLIATVLGLIGGAALTLLALLYSQIWLAILCLFLLTQSWRSFRMAREWPKYTPPVENP